eukprot:ANDGO_04922.mRNA.1 hypothetical protein GUITHDRAFT_154656
MTRNVQFPITTENRNVSICGTDTELCVSVFSNYVMVNVSQTGKPGVFVHATPDSSFEGETTFSISTILGVQTDEDELSSLLARRLVELTHSTGRSLLLTVSVRGVTRRSPEFDRSFLRQVGPIFHEWLPSLISSKYVRRPEM